MFKPERQSCTVTGHIFFTVFLGGETNHTQTDCKIIILLHIFANPRHNSFGGLNLKDTILALALGHFGIMFLVHGTRMASTFGLAMPPNGWRCSKVLGEGQHS